MPPLCPTELYNDRTDLICDAFYCRATCGTPGLKGRLSWYHDFPYALWTPNESHLSCYDHIVCLTNLACGQHVPGYWTFVLEAWHNDPRRTPPEDCFSQGFYWLPGTGNQDVPSGRYQKGPARSYCDACCPELDWPDEIQVFPGIF